MAAIIEQVKARGLKATDLEGTKQTIDPTKEGSVLEVIG